MSATEDGEEVEQDEEMADAPPPPPSAKPQEEEQSLIREAAIGKGMPFQSHKLLTMHSRAFLQH